ncbi:MAG: hypothetical protein FWD37_03325 [Methanomassiliicoccaceae archaeon]|nr:hypothetical protein [Methanomassiliicoccaceae archaeon]
MSENEITFKYKFKEDYNPVYVNGAYGGVNGRGEIMVHFFTERHPIPYEVTNEMFDNKLGKEIKVVTSRDKDSENRNLMLRIVETGIILDLNSAKEFHAWLGENIRIREDIGKDGA